VAGAERNARLLALPRLRRRDRAREPHRARHEAACARVHASLPRAREAVHHVFAALGPCGPVPPRDLHSEAAGPRPSGRHEPGADSHPALPLAPDLGPAAAGPIRFPGRSSPTAGRTEPEGGGTAFQEQDDSTMHRPTTALLALAFGVAALAGPSAGGAARPVSLPHTLH